MSGLSAAVEIQRRLPPERWAEALDALPEADQPEAREYLRGMWQRMRVVRNYRNTDPSTSIEAAARVNTGGSRADHVGRVIRAVQQHPGRTSAELARLTGLVRHEAARRTADAEHAGNIRKGEPKVCSLSGKRAVTWWPTPTRAQQQCLLGEKAA